jgi:hypothetical protein
MKYEYRRDWSNRPIFLTSVQNVFSKGRTQRPSGSSGGSAVNKGHGSPLETQEMNMQDLVYVVVTIAFFALSLGYVHFCDRVK